MPELTPEQEEMLEALLQAKGREDRSRTAAKMIDRSLYVAGTDDPVATLADGLGVRFENRFANGDNPGGYEFFTREQSALLFWGVEGDFQFAVDVYLFHLDWPVLERKLLDLSVRGLVIGVPDEDSESPLDYLLYEGGERRERSIEAIEPDEPGQPDDVYLLPR